MHATRLLLCRHVHIYRKAIICLIFTLHTTHLQLAFEMANGVRTKKKAASLGASTSGFLEYLGTKTCFVGKTGGRLWWCFGVLGRALLRSKGVLSVHSWTLSRHLRCRIYWIYAHQWSISRSEIPQNE
ncbi:hypothetical protein F4819DRAFT_257664 [Hypoxylon fuscum]|nr:hypothetical protein F4819DRAFT_257664 [Hypoxylon fuscum]